MQRTNMPCVQSIALLPFILVMVSSVLTTAVENTDTCTCSRVEAILEVLQAQVKELTQLMQGLRRHGLYDED